MGRKGNYSKVQPVLSRHCQYYSGIRENKSGNHAEVNSGCFKRTAQDTLCLRSSLRGGQLREFEMPVRFVRLNRKEGLFLAGSGTWINAVLGKPSAIQHCSVTVNRELDAMEVEGACSQMALL